MDVYAYFQQLTDPYHSFDENGYCKYCGKFEEECEGFVCIEKETIMPKGFKPIKQFLEELEGHGWDHAERERRAKEGIREAKAIDDAIMVASAKHRTSNQKKLLYIFIDKDKKAEIPFGSVVKIHKNEQLKDPVIRIYYDGKKFWVKRNQIRKIFSK